MILFLIIVLPPLLLRSNVHLTLLGSRSQPHSPSSTSFHLFFSYKVFIRDPDFMHGPRAYHYRFRPLSVNCPLGGHPIGRRVARREHPALQE
jgi:hypothetical protein